jgi:SAM-dependent methyltransferase
MANDSKRTHLLHQLRTLKPSPWVLRFAPLVKTGGCVLDLACGAGRHSRHFLEQGYKVVALDRSINAISDLGSNLACEIICANLETNDAKFNQLSELAGRHFDGIIVVNYLYRPLLNYLIDALAPGGVLIYETFARGNEQFGQPRNPDHLLKRGELLNLAQNDLDIIAYEHGIDTSRQPSVVIQRICATKPEAPIGRADDQTQSNNLFP